MSTATVQDLALAPATRPVRRSHLRLVGRDEVPAMAIAPSQGGDQLRLTRRGRLAITLTVATLLALAVTVLLGTVLSAGAASGETLVVQPGQTLSEIAATELPWLPLDRGVVQIQLANDLSTLHVQAGQELEIPGR